MIKRNLFLKNLYYLFLKINGAISLSFFRSQCYFHIILRTVFLNITHNLKNKFEPIKGYQEIDSYEIDHIFEEIKKNTPRISNKYFRLTNLENIPSFARKIVERHKTEIESFLGKSFVFEKMTFTSTKNIPKEFEQFDFYSNAWHQDSDSYKILKIFILIDNVGREDGPFTYLTHKETALYWHLLRDRFVNSTLKIQDEKQFTGTSGDYLIIDTSKNLHRASNPAIERKLLTLTLYPKWSLASDFWRVEWDSKF
jgi:hypothetical protein